MAGLYGVLDLARAPDLYPHIQRLEPVRARCLYQGRLHPEVVRHSAHLVELAPGDPLRQLWSGKGWGGAWGMWVESRAEFRAVWRRMRHFTQAVLPDGSGPVLFRFWDPRVARTFMPLIEPGQAKDWFTDVDAYVVESEDGAGAIRFTLKGAAVAAETLRLPARV